MEDAHNGPPSARKPSVRELIDEIRGKRVAPEEPPFDLPAIKSPYQKFCDATGGPIAIDGFPNVDNFQHYCFEFRYVLFRSLIERWQKDKLAGVRHWPALAYSVTQYRLRRAEVQRTPPRNRSAAEIRELLTDIEDASGRLASRLLELSDISNQLVDGTNTFRIGQIGWIDQFIAEAAAGVTAPEVSQNPEDLASAQLSKLQVLERILRIQAAAKFTSEYLNPAFLRRTRGANNPALRTLVTLAKPIWESLTERPPSTNKVATRSGDVPDFVLFIQDLAKLAGGPSPSFKQVQTAARPARTPN